MIVFTVSVFAQLLNLFYFIFLSHFSIPVFYLSLFPCWCVQVLSDGIHSTPLNLAVYWKCAATTTDLRVDYRYNPDSMVFPGPLTNIQILVPVDGGVTSMQSLPSSVW